MAKYPYYIPAPNIYKPWIKVSLNYRKTHRITPASIVALVDSGADVCFCAKYIGEWLGIKFNRKQTSTFTTANTSQFIAIEETVTLIVCNKIFDCRFFFANDLPKETPIILGQLGFFEKFKITFDLTNKEIEII